MASITFICLLCGSTDEIEIFALSSNGFNLVCPVCKHQFWFDNETNIAKKALENIVGFYRRSHKLGENTIYQMFREAEATLREISRINPDPDNSQKEQT